MSWLYLVLPGSSSVTLIPADNSAREREPSVSMAGAGLLQPRLKVHRPLAGAQLKQSLWGSLSCLRPHQHVCRPASVGSLLSHPDLPVSVAGVEGCLLVAGHWGQGQEHAEGCLRAVAAAWLCLNSRHSYAEITSSSGTKVVAGTLRPWQGAEVVMATRLCGQFSLLGIELWEQNYLVGSITECGNINDRL